MKKLFSVLCVVFMLVTLAQADEITFRGIPWGSSAQEVAEQLSMQLNLPINFFSVSRSSMPFLEAMTTSTGYPDTQTSCGFRGFPSIVGKLKVAGYSVSRFNYYSYFGNNGVSQDIADSKFYAAGYELEVEDSESAYIDLQSKLSYLYGECVSTKEWDDWREWYSCISTWYGDNNTAVSLYTQYSWLFNNPVCIKYYKTDCDETLRAIEKTVELMELAEKYKDSDLSGL